MMNDKLETTFSSHEWLRYTRHLQLPNFGVAGQSKLKASHVLVVGAGGLGSPVCLYLAAAGVGHITIVDGDHVDITNLQRQIIFTTADIGQSKSVCAKDRLLSLNPEINVNAIEDHLSVDNASTLIGAVDLVLDCTDNFSTRYLINDTCVALKKPWVFASIYQFSGQCALFTPNSACFRCLFPEAPQNIDDCNTAGVIGVLPGILGTLQANEAIKYLADLPTALENKLLMFEAMDMSVNQIQLAKNNACPVCSDNKSITDVNDYTLACSLTDNSAADILPAAFSSCRDDDNVIVVDVRTIEERQGYHIGGSHIPLSELGQSLTDLPKDKMILCYCQSGVRSQKAVELLKASNFQAKSLVGGLAGFLKEFI